MDGNDDVVPKVDRKVETSDEVVLYFRNPCRKGGVLVRAAKPAYCKYDQPTGLIA